MNLREAARLVLSDTLLAMSAKDVWAEIVRRGLDKQVSSKGKTPDATLGAYLYVASKKRDSGIVAEGKKPTLFRFVGTKPTSDNPRTLPSTQNSPKSKSKEQNSKFLGPCVEILSAHPGVPMGVADILKAVLDTHPEMPWKQSNGAVRAALLRAAKLGGAIRQVQDSVPPLFYVGETVLPPLAKTTPRKTTLTYLDSAEKVLREFGNKRPMHYRDIADKAMEQGWLVSDGEDPANILLAVVGIDIRKRNTTKKPPRFVQLGKGYIGLAEWANDPIQPAIDKHNDKVKSILLEKLRNMDWIDFENLVKRLLDEMDFQDTEVTRASGDGGIDVRGTWKVADGVDIKMAIQAKRWKKGRNVQREVVATVRGSLKTFETGMIITTSDFSKGARDEAEDTEKPGGKISLVNGEQFVKLLVKYGIGISRRQIEIIEIDSDSGIFRDKGEQA